MPDIINDPEFLRRKRVSTTQTQETEQGKGSTLIQIPGSFFPHSIFTDALWIRMQAVELRGMHTGGRGGSLQLGRKYTTFKFLAPEQIIESHNHNWEEYASIQSKILEKVVGFKTGIEQIGDVKNNLVAQFKKPGGFPSGQHLESFLARIGDVRVPKYKIDTPLRYTNSQRRQFQLTFILADEWGGKDITKAIKLLQTYAAPSVVNEININFPYIFSLNSEPEGLLKVQYAALSDIIVTWMGPYLTGTPIRAELTLTFKDMSPLFKRTIEQGGIVNVNTELREPATDEPLGTQNPQNHPMVKKNQGKVYSLGTRPRQTRPPAKTPADLQTSVLPTSVQEFDSKGRLIRTFTE